MKNDESFSAVHIPKYFEDIFNLIPLLHISQKLFSQVFAHIFFYYRIQSKRKLETISSLKTKCDS